MPFVAPGDQAGAHRRVHRRHPRDRGRGPPRGGGGAHGSDLPRLPARPRVHGLGGGRRLARRASRPWRAPPAADGDAIARAAELLRGAERPVIMAGTGLYWARGETELRALAEELGIPVFLNGLARGCVPADHAQFFSRARGTGLKGADVALVVGVPMDFRLGFGGSFGDETQIVVMGSAPPERPHPREVAAELFGGVPATLRALREAGAGGPDRSAWTEQLREVENEQSRSRAGRPERRPLAAPPDAPLPRARAGARPGRRGDRRRRRLRVVRRPRDRQLRARLLDGPRPLRVPRHRAGLRAGGQAGAPGPPGLPAARRRRLRLLGARVRHARAPWSAGGRR